MAVDMAVDIVVGTAADMAADIAADTAAGPLPAAVLPVESQAAEPGVLAVLFRVFFVRRSGKKMCLSQQGFHKKYKLRHSYSSLLYQLQ